MTYYRHGRGTEDPYHASRVHSKYSAKVKIKDKQIRLCHNNTTNIIVVNNYYITRNALFTKSYKAFYPGFLQNTTVSWNVMGTGTVE
jgi:hypothetical protein